MSIALIRKGLAINLGKIRGLRVSETIPDTISPPVAVIQLQQVDYDGALQGGLTTYTFQITCVVGRVSERTAQRTLDQYIAPGSGAVKNAIEADRSLNESAFDCRVTGLTNIGSLIINDVTYLAADFSVTVYAN